MGGKHKSGTCSLQMTLYIFPTIRAFHLVVLTIDPFKGLQNNYNRVKVSQYFKKLVISNSVDYTS